MNTPDLTTAAAFEGWLEDKGFSPARAKAITAKGFRAGDLEAGEASEIAGMVRMLENRAARFQTKRVPPVLLAPVLVGAGALAKKAIEFLAGYIAERQLDRLLEDNLLNQAVKLLNQFERNQKKGATHQSVEIPYGKSATLELPLAYRTGKARLVVIPVGDINVRFGVGFKYAKWSDAGLVKTGPVVLSNSEPGKAIDKEFEVGGTSEIGDWLKNLTRSQLQRMSGNLRTSQSLYNVTIVNQGDPKDKRPSQSPRKTTRFTVIYRDA